MIRLATTFLAALVLSAPAAELTEIPFETIEGRKTSLADYAGKVVLIVNTASKCGLTPQYEGLEALYDEYRDQGLVVLGFPSNDFKGQEPGSNEEIAEFCRTRYDVSFPMMAKIHVKGPRQHPLYAALTGAEGAFPGEVAWNFGKFLIGREGQPLARFEPRTAPDSGELVTALESALNTSQP